MARRDPSVFERTAASYARVRPGYPPALSDFVVARTGLRPGARLLELGPGPGFATEGFVGRGFHIHAVDASAAMIEVARARLHGHADLTFEQALFEEWPGPSTPVDLVYAGMAWHWLDAEVRDAKVSQWLAPDGWIAIFVNWHVTPWEDGQDLYAAHWPDREPAVRRSIDERVAQVRTDLAVHDVFEVVEVKRIARTLRYTAAEYIDVLESFSDHVVLDDAVKDAFYGAVQRRIVDLGGTIDRHTESVVLLVRRT